MSLKPRLAMMLIAAAFALAIPSAASAQGSAWGGGCQTGVSDTDVCIGFISPTLHSDFYVYGWSTVDPSGTADLYICISGVGCYYKYTVWTNFTGHYPVGQQNVNSSSGDARTEVDFWDAFSSYLGTGVSPTQYWAP